MSINTIPRRHAGYRVKRPVAGMTVRSAGITTRPAGMARKPAPAMSAHR